MVLQALQEPLALEEQPVLEQPVLVRPEQVCVLQISKTLSNTSFSGTSGSGTTGTGASSSEGTINEQCSKPGFQFVTTTDNITSGLTTCGGPTGNRIVGGTLAAANSWPWIVSMMFKSDITPTGFRGGHCGGTIINERFVLTAAHCCLDEGTTLMDAVAMTFAQHDREAADSNEFTIEVPKENFILHESYAGSNFDVCLVDVGESIFDAATVAGADSMGVQDLIM